MLYKAVLGVHFERQAQKKDAQLAIFWFLHETVGVNLGGTLHRADPMVRPLVIPI